MQAGGVSSRVLKAGVRKRTVEFVNIAAKTTTARGKRYLTQDAFARQVASGLLTVNDEELDASGSVKRALVESERYVESDAALVNRILGREVGAKQNILVFNDEAHLAYRIRREDADPYADADDQLEVEEFDKEATIWVDGLDRIHKLRGINFCVDLSATPYYLGRVSQDANRPFPWVVSVRSHLNYVVADTKVWEQSAAYIIDTHPAVRTFVKNAGLGFSVPYIHNGRPHDYIPDFIVRLVDGTNVIVETKGFDELAGVKAAAAARWVAAVNADGSFGRWDYVIARQVAAVRTALDARDGGPESLGQKASPPGERFVRKQ